MEPNLVTSAGQSRQVVVTLRSFVHFVVAGEEFAIDILRVREVIRLPSYVPVPNVPEFIEGIIQLRGRIVPVIDLRKRLKIASREITPLNRFTRVIIVTFEGKLTGFIVDAVSGILKVPQHTIKPVPEIVARQVGGEYFEGVIQHDERTIIMLNLHKVLAPAEREQLGEIDLESMKTMLLEKPR